MWKKKNVMDLTDSETQGGKQLPQLPEELIEEILKRLPVESLVRFSCTCKRWLSLIFSDSKFNRAHIHHAKRPLWKILTNGNFILKEDYLRTTIDCDCNIVTSPTPTLSSYLRYPMTVLGSCNGLLFIAGKSVSKESKQEFLLWNPYTNSVKMMDSLNVQTINNYTCQYLISGLTYDGGSDDYKAIVMLNDYKHSTYVYSLRKRSWKELLNESNRLDISNIYKFLGITVDNGMCYWKIRRTRVSSIVCFDPVVEKFKEVPFPEELPDTRERQLLRLGAVEGCISLIDRNGVVWVMKEYGCNWTKLHVFSLPRDKINRFQPLGYSSNKQKLVTLKDGYTIRILKVNKGIVRKPRSHPQLESFFVDISTLYTESLLCPWLSF